MVSFLFFVFFFLYTKMTKWSEHVKKHAKKHKMSYREASMDSKCKESYRKMSKKRMSPRKMSKKKGSARRRMSAKHTPPAPTPPAPTPTEDNVWIVVSDDYEGSNKPDDWEPENVNKIVNIFDSEQEAIRREKILNSFDYAMHQGAGEDDPGTESTVYGPFPTGMYKVGDTYEP